MTNPVSHSEAEHPPLLGPQVTQECVDEQQPVRSRLLEGQPARIYFLVAFVAFTAAGAGWLVTTLLSGWMEIAGTLAVGLFYLGLGLLEVGRRSTTESGP